MWVNYDKPTKTVTFHQDNCRYVPTVPTARKGFGEMANDGGWEHVTSEHHAKMTFRSDMARDRIKTRYGNGGNLPDNTFDYRYNKFVYCSYCNN
ncbi:hypothetical protein FHS15_005725 [Paenibacillus castaneae]|nr:hypothetical protein [Paenibacillus castaneae]